MDEINNSNPTLQRRTRLGSIRVRTRRIPSNLGPWLRSFLTLILLAALVLTLMHAYATETNLSFQLDDRHRSLNSTININERLRLEIHRENSRESLERRSVDQGFRRPSTDQYIHLR